MFCSKGLPTLRTFSLLSWRIWTLIIQKIWLKMKEMKLRGNLKDLGHLLTSQITTCHSLRVWLSSMNWLTLITPILEFSGSHKLILKLTHHDQLFCRDLKWLPHLQVSAENSLIQWSNHSKVSMILSEFHSKQRVFLLKLSRLLCLWIKFLAYSFMILKIRCNSS